MKIRFLRRQVALVAAVWFCAIITDMTPTENTIYFDATLTPNRSLSPRAFIVVMSIVVAMSFLAGLSFVSMGAFPVIGFFGLDALAIWFAFRWSFRSLRQETRVRVTAEQIDLRHEQRGRAPKTASLPTAFTRIALDHPERRPSQLKLSHGPNTWIIGRFLTPDERRSLKSALEKAVHAARSERYPS